MKEKQDAILYNPESIAPQLSSKKPFFAMRSGGAYAVELGSQRHKDGTLTPEPTNFRRVDKSRALPGRQRRKARKLERQSRKPHGS